MSKWRLRICSRYHSEQFHASEDILSFYNGFNNKKNAKCLPSIKRFCSGRTGVGEEDPCKEDGKKVERRWKEDGKKESASKNMRSHALNDPQFDSPCECQGIAIDCEPSVMIHCPKPFLE